MTTDAGGGFHAEDVLGGNALGALKPLPHCSLRDAADIFHGLLAAGLSDRRLKGFEGGEITTHVVRNNQGCETVNTKSFEARHHQSCNVRAMFRGDRLAQLLEQRNLSQGVLAKRVGVSTTAIWKLVNSPAQGSKHIHHIARELGTTPEYLMGETDDADPRVGDGPASFRHIEPEPDPDMVEVDHVDLRLGLGGSYLGDHVEVQRRKFSRAWLREFTSVAPEHLAWTKGDGDSMEPTIRSGEVVLIDRSEITPGRDDKIWAVAEGEIGMIKRLRALPSGTVEIHSDNPHVPMGTAVDGELHVIGRVVAVVRKL